MWRQYRNEDWERRKDYLIRSLFQDVPLPRLSPVPEDQASLEDSWSSRNILRSRPYSPLPPLIIEKYPNRHDDPPEFYNELEKRMKKLYRKMFCNGENSSIEDLLELYRNHDDYDRIVTDRLEFVTSSPNSELNHKTKRISKNTFKTTQSPLASDVSTTKILESSLYTDKEHSSNVTSEETASCQDTTEVVIHKPPNDAEDMESMSSVEKDAAICSSPILELKFQTQHSLTERERSNDSCGEKFSNHEGSPEKTSESQDGSIESSFERGDIELMRRQQRISLSLGSIQNNSNETDTSSIAANFEFKRKASLEMYENEDSLYKEAGDVHNLTFIEDVLDNVSSIEYVQHRSSSSNPVVNETLNVQSSNMSIKKRRRENKSVQTSGKNKRIDWKDIKKNFFVGVPQIYKLCSCDDHVCKNQFLQ